MSSAPEPAVAIDAKEAPLRAKPTGYPQPFAARVAGREKRPLGDLFGLTNFGVNLTRLAPGCVSSMRHAIHGAEQQLAAGAVAVGHRARLGCVGVKHGLAYCLPAAPQGAGKADGVQECRHASPPWVDADGSVRMVSR